MSSAAIVTDVTTTFVIPSWLSAGGRVAFGDFAVAADFHYGFNSQMQGLLITGLESNGNPASLRIPFGWVDSITVQGGLEYNGVDGIPLRVGYAFDDVVASKRVPSAFGTPPTASHSITAGAGYLADSWQLNFALAYRTMNTSVEPEDTLGNECETLCGMAGEEYSLNMVGVYLDFSIDLDVPSLL